MNKDNTNEVLFPDDIEQLLDEADESAESTDVRYTDEEVFKRVRRGIAEMSSGMPINRHYSGTNNSKNHWL